MEAEDGSQLVRRRDKVCWLKSGGSSDYKRRHKVTVPDPFVLTWR